VKKFVFLHTDSPDLRRLRIDLAIIHKIVHGFRDIAGARLNLVLTGVPWGLEFKILKAHCSRPTMQEPTRLRVTIKKIFGTNYRNLLEIQVL